MGDYARSRLQFRQKLWPEPFHEIRQNIKSYDCGFAEIGLEHILFDEFGAVLHAISFSLFVGEIHQLRIDVHAHAVRFKVSGRRYDHPAIAGTEIHDEIFGCDIGQLQHFVDDDLRRRHVRELAEFLGR